MKFDEECSVIRVKLKQIAVEVLDLKKRVSNQPAEKQSDGGEMIANLMLTYRHVEDATMRLGKSIQAFDGGKSVYDK